MKTCKTYVEVSVSFDENGCMTPRTLTWEDGTRFEIDRILDVRPAPAQRGGGYGDRYTIRIRGKERYLFFEHSPDRYTPALGRWFVEQHVGGAQSQ